jgi:hypothetical protein
LAKVDFNPFSAVWSARSKVMIFTVARDSLRLHASESGGTFSKPHTGDMCLPGLKKIGK